MNKFLIAGAALLIVLVGAGLFLMQNLDGLVKDLIEEVGSDVTKTDVRVAEFQLNLTEGKATIKGLTVANPPGFSASPLFSLDDITVAIDTASLTGSVYVIKEITVDGMSVNAKQKGATTNIQTLLDGMSTAESDGNQGDSTASSEEIELAILDFNFTNANLKLSSDIFGEKDVELKSLNLRGLGTPEDGLTPDEIGGAIASQLVTQVSAAVSTAIMNYVKEASTDGVRKKLGALFGKDK